MHLAEIFRRHWPAYVEQFGDRIPKPHREAAAALLACGTAALGGQRLVCGNCHREVYIFHSCNHRACLRCGGRRSAEWLARQQGKQLPVPYFLLTFTIPEELRAWFRSHPQRAYRLFFREVAATMMEIGANPERFGAQLGFIAVLHTWTRQLHYHPHLHLLVPGGGLTPEGDWKQVGDPNFFLSTNVLAARLRNRMKAAFQADDEAWRSIPVKTWHRRWIVDSQPAGSGDHVLKYLARYVGRTALGEGNLLADDERGITFRYQDAEDREWKLITVTPEEFLRRFLQHVLPAGLPRVRYYGFLAPAAKRRWEQIVRLLDYIPKVVPSAARPAPCCPYCQGQDLILLEELPRPP